MFTVQKLWNSSWYNVSTMRFSMRPWTWLWRLRTSSSQLLPDRAAPTIRTGATTFWAFGIGPRVSHAGDGRPAELGDADEGRLLPAELAEHHLGGGDAGASHPDATASKPPMGGSGTSSFHMEASSNKETREHARLGAERSIRRH